MRRAAVAAAIALGVARATSATPSGVPASVAPRFAVISRATPLYATPDAHSPSVRHAPRADRAADPWVVQLARDPVDGWAEILTDPRMREEPTDPMPAGWTRQCYDHPDAGGLALRFFVRARDLEPVLTREVAVAFGDGTSIALSRGVVVGPPDARGERALALGSYALTAPIPADAVGLAFEGDAHLQATTPHGPTVGGTTHLTLDHGRRPLAVDSDVTVYATARHRGGGWLVTLKALCGTFVAVLPRGAPRPEVDFDGSLRSVFGAPPAAVPGAAKAGAVVYWSSGAAAGSVAVEAPLTDEVASSPAGSGRRCFAVPLARDEPASSVVACFDPKSIRP